MIEDNSYKSCISKGSYSIRMYFSRSNCWNTYYYLRHKRGMMWYVETQFNTSCWTQSQAGTARFPTKNPYLHTYIKLQGVLLNITYGWQRRRLKGITRINLFRLLYLPQRTKCSLCQPIKASPRVHTYTASRHEATSYQANNTSFFLESKPDITFIFPRETGSSPDPPCYALHAWNRNQTLAGARYLRNTG